MGGDIVTYSLRDGHRRSDRYYRVVADFTDEVLAEAAARFPILIGAFQVDPPEGHPDAPSTFAERAFELLTLGVLWQVYGEPDDTSLSAIDRLLTWLESADDFRQEWAHLLPWRTFLATRPAGERAAGLTAARSFAIWFEGRSLEVLGRYTPHVERFLAEAHPGYAGRDDEILCGRQRVEYHLNMVGTEILTRAYRDAFRRAARQVVIAPPCMCARPSDECERLSTSFGARCTGCTPGCRVHQLTKLGEKRGFEVIIFTHDLPSLRAGLEEGEEFGVVGISCVLTNAPGGWEARALGIPAQGVLLDYCGCSWHWHETGLATDVNFRRLLRVLDRERREGG